MHKFLLTLLVVMSLGGCRQDSQPDGRQAKPDARQAGAEAARRVGEVVSVHVIARPHEGVAQL